MTARKLFKQELSAIEQPFALGVISDTERQRQIVRAKYLYVTQIKEEE